LDLAKKQFEEVLAIRRKTERKPDIAIAGTISQLLLKPQATA